MKKTFKYMTLAVAAMSMAACSSDDLGLNEGQDPAQWAEDGTGYMAINLNLPTTNGSGKFSAKRMANDSFEDGEANEYEVNDLTLILFGSNTANEADAQFAGAYTITDHTWNSSTDGNNGTTHNITTHSQVVTKISRMGGNHAFALAVLNNNGIFNVNGTELKVNGVNFTGTINDLQNLIIDGLNNDAAKFHTTGFLMLNAPLANKPGGNSAVASDTKIQVLAPIDRSQIKDTKEAAQAAAAAGNVASQIYVERAVAKVTMNEGTGSIATVTGTTGDPGVAWTLDSWALDNTNKTSYLVRNTNNFTNWMTLASEGATTHANRFVGHTGAETNGLYRTYFAQDPNYTSYETTSFNYVGNNRANVGDLIYKAPSTSTTSYPAYCAENTFNVRQQIWGATTRVIIKATLNGGEDFYSTGEGAAQIYTAEGITNVAKAEFIASLATWFTNHAVSFKSYNTANALQFSMLTDGKAAADKKPTFKATWTDGADKLEFRNAQEIADAKNTAQFGGTDWHSCINPGTGVAYTSEPAGWHTADTEAGEVLSVADMPAYTGAGVNVYVYEGGVTYYEARIKHFGDDQTPWNVAGTAGAWETPKPSVTAGAYPGDDTAEKRYLGRWGVLRNNWYDLSISKISKVGSPLVPTLQGNEHNTDDELDQYIAVDVNILSWAKRTQDVAL